MFHDADRTSATPVTDHLRNTGNFNPAWQQMAELDPVWLEKFQARENPARQDSTSR